MARTTWNSSELENFISSLDKLNQAAFEELAGTAIYSMANEVANQVRQNLSALATSEDKEYKGNSKYLIPEAQKQGLLNSLGIASMRKEGSGYDVRIGFDGYNDVHTKTYPQGQPNTLIARLTESGSTWRVKQPFFRPALNASKKRAQEAGIEKAKAFLLRII
ncbi:MAG: hypothetical protein IJ091_11365 [Oscillospiraceae bacterium]|nr:hypothetical protein [Oscillospiraceae bacterium]MBQ8996398.1 hypothetical protein [Oscillospiraceae bacterium]